MLTLAPDGHGKSWMHFPSYLSVFVPAFPSVWSSQTLLEPRGVDIISYRKPSLLPPVRTYLLFCFYLPLLEPLYPSALYFELMQSCFSPPLDQELVGACARSHTCCFPLKFSLFRCLAPGSTITEGQETGLLILFSALVNVLTLST